MDIRRVKINKEGIYWLKNREQSISNGKMIFSFSIYNKDVLLDTIKIAKNEINTQILNNIKNNYEPTLYNR